jgi:glycosyltransferase involved in cell wall biosynthesis
VSRLPPDVPIVVLASAPWKSVGRLNCHHLATRFASCGHRVLFVESTGLRSPAVLGSGHDRSKVVARLADFARGQIEGPREVAPNLWVVSPLAAPWGWPEPWRRTSLAWVARQVRAAARRLGFERPVVWAQLPSAAAAARAVAPRGIVYHCADDYASNPGVDGAWVAALERRLLEEAEFVFASSPVLGERLRVARPDTEVWPNVADVKLFSRAVLEDGPEPALLSGLPRPRAVYVGNISTYKLDVALLDELAHTLPWLQIVLVGEVGLGDTGDAQAGLRTLCERENVRRLSAQPPAALPDLLRHCDVGLIPFVLNGHTRSSLPLKLFEYLAAGLPVVATELPNLRAVGPEWAVRLTDGPGTFPALVEKALGDGASRRADRLELASAHDWEPRMDAILHRLGERLAAS